MGHILAHLDLIGLFCAAGIQGCGGLTGSSRLLLVLLVLLGRTLLLSLGSGLFGRLLVLLLLRLGLLVGMGRLFSGLLGLLLLGRLGSQALGALLLAIGKVVVKALYFALLGIVLHHIVELLIHQHCCGLLLLAKAGFDQVDEFFIGNTKIFGKIVEFALFCHIVWSSFSCAGRCLRNILTKPSSMTASIPARLCSSLSMSPIWNGALKYRT